MSEASDVLIDTDFFSNSLNRCAVGEAGGVENVDEDDEIFELKYSFSSLLLFLLSVRGLGKVIVTRLTMINVSGICAFEDALLSSTDDSFFFIISDAVEIELSFFLLSTSKSCSF
jgi:hypothetical protein